MEIVGKRKRDQNGDMTPEPEHPEKVLPQEVQQLLRLKEKKCAIPLEALFNQENTSLTFTERQRRIDELEGRLLLPAQIREQVMASLHRNNTPRQILSVVNFLYDHQSAVLLGEKLPPAGSVFSRVPFSTH